MISIIIVLVRGRTRWHISRCGVELGDRIRVCPCPRRSYQSKHAATEAMKRRAMQYLRQKGCTDSPLDIEWLVAIADPSQSRLTF